MTNYGSTSSERSNAADALHAALRADESDASAPRTAGAGADAPGKETHHTLRRRLHAFYARNIGLVLVLAAQTFGSIMSTAAKLLTSQGTTNKLHALQIIFVRMLFTTFFCCLYMWWKQVRDFPLGPRGVRGLLVFRGLAGFVGLFGLYYSLMYLEISDATAITFLVPTWTAIVCYLWLKEPYHLQEFASGLIALFGVLLIARPAFLFGAKQTVPTSLLSTAIDNLQPTTPTSPLSPMQRTLAILGAILNTVAAAVAYSTIRVIGPRAHSLVSVNYFAVLATIGSAVVILVHPGLQFVLPQGVGQWVLLVVIGVSGFLLQFLLTEGLQREKGARATNMIYVQMVFALGIERVVWGTTPPVESLVGSGLIIASSVWLTLQKSRPVEKKVVDEERSLLGAAEGRRES